MQYIFDLRYCGCACTMPWSHLLNSHVIYDRISYPISYVYIFYKVDNIVLKMKPILFVLRVTFFLPYSFSSTRYVYICIRNHHTNWMKSLEFVEVFWIQYIYDTKFEIIFKRLHNKYVYAPSISWVQFHFSHGNKCVWKNVDKTKKRLTVAATKGLTSEPNTVHFLISSVKHLRIEIVELCLLYNHQSRFICDFWTTFVCDARSMKPASVRTA